MNNKLEVANDIVYNDYIFETSFGVFACRKLRKSDSKPKSEYIMEICFIVSVLLVTTYNIIRAQNKINVGRCISRGPWYTALVVFWESYAPHLGFTTRHRNSDGCRIHTAGGLNHHSGWQRSWLRVDIPRPSPSPSPYRWCWCWKMRWWVHLHEACCCRKLVLPFCVYIISFFCVFVISFNFLGLSLFMFMYAKLSAPFLIQCYEICLNI